MLTKLQFLTSTPTLWGLLVATLLLTLTFMLLSNALAITFVDAMSDPEQVRQSISALTTDQKHAHAWITATVDVAYPLAYGGLFAGAALKFYPQLGGFLALPSLIVIPVDLLEGVVQILALADITDWLQLKAILTPAKTTLFLAGLAIAAVGGVRALIRRLSKTGG